MAIHSNIDDFCRNLEHISDILNLEDGLGDEIGKVFGDRMVARCAMAKAPDGATWPENEPRYAARKGGLPVGVLTGEMLSEDNIRGQLTITRNSVTMAYKGGDFERQKLGWFAAGGRVVWGMDEEMREGFRTALRDHARGKLGGR